MDSTLMEEIKTYYEGLGIRPVAFEELSLDKGLLAKLYRKGMTPQDIDELLSTPDDFIAGECWEVEYKLNIHFLEKITRFLEVISSQKPDMKVIDAGCAVGLHSGFLAKHFPKASFEGYDRNPRMIDYARKRYEDVPNLTFYVAEHANPGIYAGAADVIYAQSSLKSRMYPDPSEHAIEIAQLASWVRPGGFIIDNGLYHEKCACDESMLKEKGISFVISQFMYKIGNKGNVHSHYYQVDAQKA